MKIFWKVSSKYEDDINTDDIIRADVLQESTDKAFFAKHAFEKFDHKFVEKCSKEESNVIVAWNNFGCGSSREQAIYALSFNNIKCVIAESFPDIFYRNAFNNGFLLIKIENVRKLFRLWDDIEIDIENLSITNKTTEKILSFFISDYHKRLIIEWWQVWIVKSYIWSRKVDIKKSPDQI